MPAKVLVVDDNISNLKLICEILRYNGYDIIKTTFGDEAIELANKFHPDLVIADIMMPEIDGHEVVNEIKKNPALREIPVIMITASNARNDVIKSRENEVVDYILKPISVNKLVERIHRILPKAEKGMGRYINEGDTTVDTHTAEEIEDQKEEIVTVLEKKEESLSEIDEIVSGEDIEDDDLEEETKKTMIIEGFPVTEYKSMQLKPGMITGDNIVGPGGAIIVSIGSELTKKQIERIKSMSIDKIYIRE